MKRRRDVTIPYFLLMVSACGIESGLSQDAANGAPDSGSTITSDAGARFTDAGSGHSDSGAYEPAADPDSTSWDGGAASRDAGRPPSDASGLPDEPALKDRLTGVNWFGFETSNLAPHGLWARDYKSVLKQIKDLGFNTLRLPWCNDVLTGSPNSVQINAYGTDPYTKSTGLNTDLEGLSSIQIMDKILAECERLGLKVILDNHSRTPDGYMNSSGSRRRPPPIRTRPPISGSRSSWTKWARTLTGRSGP